MAPDYASLYVDYGNDVHNENMVKFIRGEDSVYRLSLNFGKDDKVNRFRVDPSLYPCVMLLLKMTANGREDLCRVQHYNYDDQFGNLFAFFRDDPCVVFHCRENILTLEIEILVDTGTYAFSLCAKKIMADKRLRLANAYKTASEAQEKNKLADVLSEAAKTIADMQENNLKEDTDGLITSLQNEAACLRAEIAELKAKLDALLDLLQNGSLNANNTK
jgi:hypothetical protein